MIEALLGFLAVFGLAFLRVPLAVAMSIAGLVGLGLQSDDVRVGSASLKGKVDNIAGVFVKPKVMLGDTVELFGRAGVATTKVSASAGSLSISDRGTSFAYGGGASFALTPALSINADYMRYYDRKGQNVPLIQGPAILEQPDATTVIDPDLSARVDGYGNVIVERSAR